MRYAVLADIHSNIEAFKAILGDAESRGGFAQIWCLGDIVGYGPNPCECLEILRSYDHICVAGNHDWASVKKVSVAEFNLAAAQACLWTSNQLGVDDIDYLSSLPEVVNFGDFTLVHGSPREPIWEYVLSIGVAKLNFKHFNTNYCLIGHSHVPRIYTYSEKEDMYQSVDLSDGQTLELSGQRMILNPGGVGQPRDGNPKASYMIYDSDTGNMSLHRVGYNYHQTQEKMKKHSLPDLLIDRLAYGY